MKNIDVDTVVAELRRLADTIERAHLAGDLADLTFDGEGRADTEPLPSPDRGRTPVGRMLVARHESMRVGFTVTAPR